MDLGFCVRISLPASHCKAVTRGADFIGAEMRSFLEHPSLSFTICLSVAFLLTSSPSRAQDAQDKPASQDIQGIQNSTDDTDTTEGKTQGNSDQYFGGPIGPNYILGPEDVIKIEVFDLPELSKTARVANDGTISLPLIGRVQAAGLTADQLRKELADKWGENYLQDPQVTVFVSEFKAKPVSIIGAVEKPALYPLTGRRTLIEMLSMAGGFGKKNTSPAGRTVLVTRKSGFGDLQPVDGMHVRGPDQIEIDLNRLLYTRDQSLNIEIRPLDIISVSKAEVVYVTGAVVKPGGFVLEDRPSMTVLQAVAMAQGLTFTAARKSARIIRTNQDGSRREVPINLSKIIGGKAQDTTLTANDILFVPDSKQKMVAQRAIDASVSTFSGWLIWAH
jgi:polysaccharide export outer membrane protein